MNRRILWVRYPCLLLVGWCCALADHATLRKLWAAEPSASSTRQSTLLETRRFLLSPESCVTDANGAITLRPSILVADEMGATDPYQGEPLSERVWAKKIFVLDSADVKVAELFLFGKVKQIQVNGQPLSNSERLASTGWTRAKVQPSLLKVGENEVVLWGGGSLLVEPARLPGRSFKSTDGGRNWSNHQLGPKGNLQGEYLVRLRLGRYPTNGWAMSEVIDLWAGAADGVATPGSLRAIHLVEELTAGRQPEGATLASWLRTGSTPMPEEKTWTSWHAFKTDYVPEASVKPHRWAQLKIELASQKPQLTPTIPPQLKLTWTIQPTAGINPDKRVIDRSASANGGQPIRVSSVPFVYQEPSARLKLLRERYQLDQVIAAGKTEMEQLMLLRYWVRNQWHTAWKGQPASWMPPWDALIILESKDQPDCLTMCTHYAAVFTQCCLALGWNARHCILDHHCVSEVWVDQHRKWVMMDAGNSAQRADVGLHFERQGVPLSALELHQAQQAKQTDGITVCFTPALLVEQVAPLCRPAPIKKGKPSTPRPETISVAELPKFPVCGVNNFRRYAFPARNNYLASLYPGELYQGWSSYFYDGYWWIGESPEYSRPLQPTRPQDIDWTLNWTRIHLTRTSKLNELQVDLETFTPNLARLEMTTEATPTPAAATWKATAATFIWKLEPGQNVLRVRSVNRFERLGGESRVVVQNADP